MLRGDQSRGNMQRALAAVRSQVAPTEPIFVDFQSYFMIRFYLCPEIGTAWDTSVPGFRSFPCGGYRVISTQPDLNIFTADSFATSWPQMLQAFHLQTGQRVWIFQAGWDIGLAQQLGAQGKFPVERLQTFEKNVNLFEITVR